MVQLRLLASDAEGMSLIPGWGTINPYVTHTHTQRDCGVIINRETLPWGRSSVALGVKESDKATGSWASSQIQIFLFQNLFYNLLKLDTDNIVKMFTG